MATSYALLSLLLLGLLCTWLITNWLKLSKAPSPVLAGTTDLWPAYQQRNGQLRTKLIELHARYGPIVRYGVRSISISDPEVINVVYGSRAGFITADSYKVLVGISNGKEVPNLVSTADEARHGALRRSVANAFTPTASLDYEKWIDATIAELLDVIGRKKKTTPFDLANTILFYKMDAAGRFSFGEPIGCLAAEVDVGGSIQLIRDRFTHWGRWSSLPGLERLLYRNPRAPSGMAAAAAGKLRARAAAQEKKDGGGSEHADLLQLPRGQQGEPADAGHDGRDAGDTTAASVTSALYFLLKNSDAMYKLEQELAGAKLPEIPSFAAESMRVFSSATWPMERLVPDGGVTIAGMFFPAGTSVGCFPSAIHRNTKLYGEDAGVFRPERWLTPDREALRLMEAAHMGFSRGRRSCLGQNIAVMQMKKVIPALVVKFQMSLVDPDAPLDADFAPAVACSNSLYVRSEAKE
ncbi:Uu.00g067750.m01.CDS01 [Anthostomella pinea]|uniref:Uu.00g067750.m01.CDS01 n=1 Tax=Anthostomella pinea TaxID=933095 RepID=A0AAI8YNG1_9PEZI|nr:Uu.00g067750.m01.CDS01 [Anthostomella pinea]